MVVSNLFLWYDEGQDLFFGKKKNLQFLFQKCFEKKRKKQKQKMEEENMKNTKVYVEFYNREN
mgnify:CR=1 FL=1